ncbi:MAG: carboxypeptidase regulatory-like domain-containing protein [Planctomycetes bacterium]|nr:carboxypeptidase regulatory-like domain-containing protein [Planctomycetota bacterium]
MSKRWVMMCLAGCFGAALSIAGISSSSVYAAEGKKLAVEGTVFDLKAASSLTVYGYVSDKGFHPVFDATVTAKPSKGPTQSASSESNGSYSLNVEPGQTYTLSANKGGLGKTKAIKLKIKGNEDSDLIVNFQFKKEERR